VAALFLTAESLLLLKVSIPRIISSINWCLSPFYNSCPCAS
jgi:hypothetical protein